MEKCKHAGRSRGLALIEVLIVVAIMALVSAGVAMAVIPLWENSRKKTAETSARAVRDAVKGYWALQETSDCPSFADLVKAGAIDEASSRKDPWGSPFRIECDGPAVRVTSFGPDKKADTPDDIRVPPKET